MATATGGLLDNILNSGSTLFGQYLNTQATKSTNKAAEKTAAATSNAASQANASLQKVLLIGAAAFALILVIVLVVGMRRR